MIDPNIWQSEDFSKLSTLAKLVFIGLFSNADDEGRGRAKAAYIKSILFPYDEGIRIIDVDKTLSEIASNTSVTFYLHDESEYYSLDNWTKWQTVEKPKASILPPLDEHSVIIRGCVGDASGTSRGCVGDASGTNRGRVAPKRKEEKKKGSEERENARAREKFGTYGRVLLTESEHEKLVAEFTGKVVAHYVGIVDELAQQSDNKYKWTDFNVVVRRAIREKWGTDRSGANGRRKKPVDTSQPANYDLVEFDRLSYEAIYGALNGASKEDDEVP